MTPDNLPDLDARGAQLVDPRVGLILAIAAIFAMTASASPLFSLCFFALSWAVMPLTGVPWRKTARRMAGPLGMAAMVLALQSLMTGATPLWSSRILGMVVSIKTEGLNSGLLTASRMAGAVSVFMLLSSAVSARGIFMALKWLKTPQALVELAVTMTRQTFTILETAREMASAQKARLGYGGGARTISSAGILSGAVILHAAGAAKRTHDAMLARGYNGSMPMSQLPPLGARLRIQIATGLAGVCLAFMLSRGSL
ncbi:MAG: hypothetical protein HZB29_00875 [Nitrospinae bacterium]|nr:hypothetical protein [Nitrospinota bacterium]